MTAQQVIIHTDPGIDDAMAIFLALASPELDVVGLTTVYGKTWPNLGGTDHEAPAAWRGRPPVTVCVDVDAAGVVDLVDRRLTS